MELVSEIGTKNVNGKWIGFGIYFCPVCMSNVEMQNRSGKKAKTCFKCINRTHGETKTRLFRIWTAIKSRAKLKSGTYADLRVEIYERWASSFKEFKKWAIENGYNEVLTIDRIDNRLGYYPSNCRWATMTTQQNNKREIQKNNTTGHKGISIQGKKFRAGKTINKKAVCFGLFDTMEEAIECYKKMTL
jgi:hypothetical protein